MKIYPNAPGLAVGRLIKALIVGGGSAINASDYESRQSWNDTPEVGLSLRAITDPMDTSSSLSFNYVQPEFLTLLGKVAAFEQLKSFFLQTAVLVRTPFESVAPVGDFVSETNGIPVRDASIGNAVLPQHKLANIVVTTSELAKLSAPSSPLIFTRITVNENAFTLDKKFFDNAPATVGYRPAGITASGATAVPSTGSTAAAIAADIASMIAALTAPWRNVVWCMKQSTFSAITARIPTSIAYVGGKPHLLGIPVYFSLGIGAQIVLFDAASIIYAEGDVTIDASSAAMLEMSANPLSGDESPLVPSNTVMKSLFQNGLTAFKIERFISWKRSLDAAVVSMAVSY